MVVRELLTRLGFQIDQKPLKQFESNIASLKNGLASLGVALSAYGTFQFFKSAAQASEEILNTSQKIGVGVESLQRLKYAAELADVGFQGLAGGLKFLNKNFIEAQEGSKEAAKSFSEALGGSFDPKKFRSTEELFITIADQFKAMPDGAKKTALAMKIFGRSGVEIIPMLNAGSDAIRRQGEELEALGGVLGVDALKAGDDFGDNLTRLKTFFLALRNTIAARFFPAINGLIDRFVEFLKQNRAVIKERLDHYLNAVARVAKFLLTVVTALFKGFDMLAQALGSVEAAAIATTVAMATFGVITGMVSVVTLAVLALAAAIFLLWEDYQTFAEGGESLLEWPKWIKAVKAEFEALAKVLGSIKDFFEFFIANPIGKFVAKAWENDFYKNKLARARTREDIDDEMKYGDVNLAPDITMPFFEDVGGQAAPPPLMGIGQDAPLPPLLDMAAPAPAGLVAGDGDKTTNNDVNISHTIQVNVTSDADANQIADEVTRRVREQNEKDWVETDRALEGGTFN